MNIEIDSARLRSDISTLRETLTQIQKQINFTTDAIMELDSTWDGPANREFLEGYQKSKHEFQEFCEELSAFTDCMEFAAEQYEQCEDEVYDAIRAL
ncbi:MAG: WXG100 family type VII secretion target [Oscillospiraceae bacterium]|nr:WXG100 family type VII secretion target [Oscillospiraceae bacterium]